MKLTKLQEEKETAECPYTYSTGGIKVITIGESLAAQEMILK